MNNNLDLPNLADWWPIPVGASLEQGDRYAIIDSRGDIAIYTSDNGWTPPAPSDMVSERRISVPLPAEQGTELLVKIACRSGLFFVQRRGSVWRDQNGSLFSHGEIVEWARLTDLVWVDGPGVQR